MSKKKKKGMRNEEPLRAPRHRAAQNAKTT